jgi:hypothetical protein
MGVMTLEQLHFGQVIVLSSMACMQPVDSVTQMFTQTRAPLKTMMLPTARMPLITGPSTDRTH